MESDNREKILSFLQWEDRNGCYTDENCILEGVSPFTYEEAVKYFFGVINSEYYFSVVDNIFELSYEEAINQAKENGFYEETIRKLNVLITSENTSSILYKSLLN